ncbi:MAG: gluconate 5-dehydrogenase [Opitutaceae bacterium]|jgi:NAD(P)-dependent dehydrogenase (short-subunit alcohol dehydrogenase family)|nr:gluconate 5-dehydrogenase [Opitutaceae bacterium]|tara:strand:- start:912 stop:1682 length:771 start_codon:yes stop_codon:yes gene_type:complete
MNSPSGKTIWITGGAGYLGTPTTIALDQCCAKVLCIDLPGKAAALVKSANLQHTVPVELDVNDPATLPAAVAALIAEHGAPDGLAHLTVATSMGHTLEDLPAETFQATLDRSLVPTFVLCRELAKSMQASGGGSLVLFSSMYGLVPPDKHAYREEMKPNPIDYGVSKAGMIQLARYLAMHYGPDDIRVNCIAPGPFPNPVAQAANPDFVNTLNQKTMLRRIGRNNEMLGPVLFLLSDQASYVTGQTLSVDGGWTAW